MVAEGVGSQASPDANRVANRKISFAGPGAAAAGEGGERGGCGALAGWAIARPASIATVGGAGGSFCAAGRRQWRGVCGGVAFARPLGESTRPSAWAVASGH